MLKQFLNSVIAKYRNLLVSRHLAKKIVFEKKKF